MKTFALLAMVAVVSIPLGGCGSCVSQKEYLETMMVEGATANVMAYVPPTASSDSSPVDHNGVVLATDLRLDDSTVALGASPASRGTLGFNSNVRRQIEALTREMRLLESRAELKGAPTRAALEPKLRTFNSAIDRLNARLAESRGTDNQLEVEVALAVAQEAAREANDVVTFTRGLGENRSGT